MNIEQEIQKDQTEKKDFLDFNEMKNKENISKDFFDSQLKDFESKTGEQGKQILNNLQSFLEKNKIDDVKWQLAIMLLIEKLIEKKWEKYI